MEILMYFHFLEPRSHLLLSMVPAPVTADPHPARLVERKAAESLSSCSF